MNKKNSHRPAPQPGAPRTPPIVGADTCPTLFTDGSVTFKTMNGVLGVTFAENIEIPIADGRGGVNTITRCVAHLRFPPRAAPSIIDGVRGAMQLYLKEVERERQARAAAKAKAAPAQKPAAPAAAQIEEQPI